MSADNAVYVRSLPGGRVVIKEIHSLNPEWLTNEEIDEGFSDVTDFYHNMWTAVDAANLQCDQIGKEGRYVEYGVEILRRWSPEKNEQILRDRGLRQDLHSHAFDS